MRPKSVPAPEAMSSFFRVIGEPNRWRILNFLLSGERCVCEITAGLGLAQNLVSHHLRVLREHRLVKFRLAEGGKRWSYYDLNREEFQRRLAEAALWATTKPSWESSVACHQPGRPKRPTKVVGPGGCGPRSD